MFYRVISLLNRMKIDFSSKPVQWVTLILLAFTWGSSFILMKRGLESFAPEEVAAYRVFIVFVCLLPFSFRELNLLKGTKGAALASVGIFGSALPYFLFIVAQTKIASSMNGILNSLTPLFTLIFAFLFFGQRFKALSILGVILGLTGATGLIYFGIDDKSALTFTWFTILPVIASASYGFNVNLIKMYLQEVKPLQVTALSFLFVGPAAGVYLFAGTDFLLHLNGVEAWKNFGYINILGIVGTALAVWIFNMLIKETSALFASSVTYMIPIVAIMWGLLDGEVLHFWQWVSTGVILLAVSLINSKRRFKKTL